MSSPSDSVYLKYIDGLRAIAVISVIIYHIDATLLPGGFVGVDIFFVISGFVVSRSASQWGGPSLRGFLAQFYARRIVRIAPALVTCLIVTTLASVLFIPYAFLSGTNQRTGLAAFFGFSNVVLAATSNDYFSPWVAFNSFTHTWSLAVEEQFYLIFPWLFIFWTRNRRVVSLAVFGVAVILSLFIAWGMSIDSPDRAFYLIQGRFWELASGVALFQLTTLAGRRNVAVPAATAMALASIVVTAVSLATASPASTPFPGAILPVLGTLGILYAGGKLPPSNLVIRTFNTRVIGYVGRTSYSLYLWHWPVFVLFRWTVGLETPVLKAVSLILIVALSVASFHWVENPTRRALPRSGLSRPAIVGIGLSFVCLGWGVSSGLWSARSFISLSVVNRNNGDWYGDADSVHAFNSDCRLLIRRKSIPGGVAEVFSRTGCTQPVHFAHRLFVFGDSHAAAYAQMLKQFVMNTGGEVEFYASGGCAFFSLLYPASSSCEAFQAAATADTNADLRADDVVFLPALRLPRIAEEFARIGMNAALERMIAPASVDIRRQQEVAATVFARELEAKGVVVVFEAPLPVFPSPIFRCVDWFNRGSPICADGFSIGRDSIEDLRAPVMASFAKLQSRARNVRVWDPLPVVCPGETCSAFKDGRPLFFDADHLSGFGNTWLEPDFEAFVLRGDGH